MADSSEKTGTGVRIFIATHLMALSVAIFAFFLLLGYLLLFSPELKRIRQANISKSLEEERQAKTLYLASLGELADKYRDLDGEKVASLRLMVPEADDIPSLLAMIEASASHSDVSLTSVNFAKGELDGGAAGIEGLAAVNVTLSVAHASYPRFKLFLERLETNLRLFDIRSIDMNPAGASYNLSIRAYTRISETR